MQSAEGGWGRYALEVVHGRAKAEFRYEQWAERAREVPGAEVRVMSWKDPLGGETFVFCTETLELVPPRMRRPMSDLLPRVSEMKARASVEDREVFEFLEGFLRRGSRQEKPSGDRVDETVARLLGSWRPSEGA
jgi:hypothetical protein